MSNKDAFNINEGNFKSLKNELKFEIGEQYELNEFNLNALESTFNNTIEYDNYLYIKDDFKELFGIKLSSNIILQYNGDVLSKAIYEFDKENYNVLKSKIEKYTLKDETSFQIVLTEKK